MDKISGERCPMCMKNSLALTEDEQEVPYFGKAYIFSMACVNKECDFKQADVEAEKPKDPCRVTFTTESEKDMNVRVVKSSAATIKIPQLHMSVEPGAVANGYISNIEGLLQRFEEVLKEQRDNDDDSARKTAKNLLKKIWKVKLGEVPLKIIIEDPTGNSAIISEKAAVEKLKGKK